MYKSTRANDNNDCDRLYFAMKLIDELDDKRNKLSGIARENVQLQKRLAESYDALWNEYRNKKDELDGYKTGRECAEYTIGELNKENQMLTRQLRERNAAYKCLEAELGRLERVLADERSENGARERGAERISAELRDATEALRETQCELRRRTEESGELRLALESVSEKLSRTLAKHEIEKLLLAKDADVTGTELKLERHRNAGLNATVCEQDGRLRSQADALRESSGENERLRRALATERARADQCSDRLKNDALRAADEKREWEGRLEECAERSRRADAENERLRAEADGLRCRLDAAVKNGDERYDALAARTAEELKRLNAEADSKNRIIAELQREERLRAAERTTAARCEPDTDTRRRSTTTNACQTTRSDESSLCSSPFFRSYAKVLDELKSTGEYPRIIGNDSDDYCSSSNNSTSTNSSSSTSSSSAERLLEKNDSFDKFISRCESIVRNYSK